MSRNRTGLIFAFALLAPSAMAASLPGPKAPPPSPYTAPAAAFSWTGLYAGVQAGGVWLSDKGKAVDKFGGAPVGTAAAKGSGFSGGLLAGYNWQYNNLVMGVEGDVEASSARAKASTFQSVFLGPVAAGTATARFASPWRGSLRLRAGFGADRALFYVTGGLALASFNSRYSTLTGNAFGLLAGSESFSTSSAGWTLGAGGEYALTNNLIARLEYRYSDFGAFRNNLSGIDVTSINGFWAGTSVRNRLTENNVRFAVIYKFN